jgi:uncharacterized protein (UPF0218 family)
MPVAYVLTPELRIRLKEPMGTLVQGSFVETMARFKELVANERPKCIISVGDTVSKNLVKNGLLPKLAIVDNKAMRKPTEPISLTSEKVIRVKNPAATITEEAVKAIQNALGTNNTTRIVVDGEEDLLTLVAVAYAPEGSFVVYGQPHEGIVIVKATPAKKAEIAGILKTMVRARKAK